MTESRDLLTLCIPGIRSSFFVLSSGLCLSGGCRPFWWGGDCRGAFRCSMWVSATVSVTRSSFGWLLLPHRLVGELTPHEPAGLGTPSPPLKHGWDGGPQGQSLPFAAAEPTLLGHRLAGHPSVSGLLLLIGGRRKPLSCVLGQAGRSLTLQAQEVPQPVSVLCRLMLLWEPGWEGVLNSPRREVRERVGWEPVRATSAAPAPELNLAGIGWIVFRVAVS